MLPKRTSGTARTRFVFVLAALLAVNAAVAHIVTAQITDVAGGLRQVKDEQVVIEEASEIADEEEASDEEEGRPQISLYTVQSGDTISGIATKFGISSNTIRWANEIPANGFIKVGQVLVILPINGIQYTVKKGDTISGIASKFDADAQEILYFNDLDDPKLIQPGLELVIPDAEPVAAPKKTAPKTTTQPKSSPETQKTSPTPTTPSAFSTEDTHDHSADAKEEVEEQEETPAPSQGTHGIFIVPAPGSVVTQGYHAVNAVDFGAKTGSPIVAAAEGTVIVAKAGCPQDGNMRSRCNGGFGNFVVISHANGIQTLYAHLSTVSVSVGDSVDQGEKIGGMGDSGRSSGTHLHFETHGIKNPFTKYKKGTRF